MFVVRGRGVEPPQPYGHHPLKVACLPFHHPRVANLPQNYSLGVATWQVPKNTVAFRHVNKGRLAQLVRASRLHREGRGFESPGVHHELTK